MRPSIEVAGKIADALEVSLDYLTGTADMEMDKVMLDRVLNIQQLEQADKDHILFTLDAMLRDAKARQAYAS